MSQITTQIPKICYSEESEELMDLFIDRPTQHHTAVTLALTLERNQKSTKTRLQTLYKYGFLSRVDEKTGIYYLQVENIKLWRESFIPFKNEQNSKLTCTLCNIAYKSERRLKIHRQKYHNGLCSECLTNSVLVGIYHNQTVCQSCFEKEKNNES